METQANVIELKKRVVEDSKSALDEFLREGARRMLQEAIEREVAEYIEGYRHLRGEDGLRQVVRNGSMPERELLTPTGSIPIKQPRVNDRRSGEKFTSRILPPYLRRSPSLEALIPALYLRGVSTGGFAEALEAILGEGVKGLSSATIVRLKEVWQTEYEQWSKRDLTGKRYVYIWADGIYFNVRLSDDRPCMLVVMGTTDDGRKELLAIQAGERESQLSWKELLLDLKRRGMTEAPKLAVADGGLGFWAALPEVFPTTREQRCWVHKTANVLDKMPKKIQERAKQKIHGMYLAGTKKEALQAYDFFFDLYASKYPGACKCLEKDKEALFTFYDFPEEHWSHIRSTNPIESTFATVRHRTKRTKGCGSRQATLTMVYKLVKEAEKHWRRLNGYQLIIKVLNGVRYEDGEEVTEQPIAA